MPFTEAQQWALVMAPKVTGLISFLLSGLVIVTVLICPKKCSTTYHRLLLGISCVDASSSFWLGLSTWPIPEETGILLASGTTTSCTVQGFFTQFGISSSFYNASLSLFYLLVIRYSWKENRVLKLEPWLHAVPIMWGLGTAIAGLPLTIFNSANLWCWIAPYGDRGANADLYRWVFFYGPLWLMIFIVTINVLLVFRHVQILEAATARYQRETLIVGALDNSKQGGYRIHYTGDLGIDDSTGANSNETDNVEEEGSDDGDSNPETRSNVDTEEAPSKEYSSTTISRSISTIFKGMSFRGPTDSTIKKRRQRSRDVANQSLRFAGSLYFTWAALTLTRLLQAINGRTYYPILLIAAMTTPLQGLPNLLVYIYPRYKKAKRERPDAGAFSLLKDSIAPEVSKSH